MGQLGALIEAYRDRQKYRPKNADLARDLHVARSTVGNWLDGTMPKPAHLRALSTLLDVPYLRVLDAVLEDAGYLPRAGEPGGDTAAIVTDVTAEAPTSPELKRAAGLRRPPARRRQG